MGVFSGVWFFKVNVPDRVALSVQASQEQQNDSVKHPETVSPISGGNDTVAVKDTKSVSFLKLEQFIPTGLTNDFLLFDHIPS